MKIVVLDGYTLNPGDLSWGELQELGELTVYDRTPPELVVERSKGAEIIFTNKTPVSEAVLKSLPGLRYVGVLATGYNVVDTGAAGKLGITVTNVPSYGTYSVAQMVFALLLELSQHVQYHSDSVMRGKWSESPDFCYWEYPLVELYGKTMGIIGFGNIGKKVADIATAFGMNILAADKFHSDQSHRQNFRWTDTAELISSSDVVSINCPLTSETEGLIDKELLSTMKSTAFLINTSRGPVIVEKDLADALNNGIIAGAGLDVLSVEPPSQDNPLFNAKNCIITPHISWATREARGRLLDKAVYNLKSFLKGTAVNSVV